MTDTKSIYLGENELGCNSAFGVPCDWVGEDGDMVAVTSDRQLGLNAITAVASHDLHGPVDWAEVQTGWAQFLAAECDAEEWGFHFCEVSAPGALPVVVALQVGEAGR